MLCFEQEVVIDIEDAVCSQGSDVSSANHDPSDQVVIHDDNGTSSSDAVQEDPTDPRVFIKQSKRKWREELEVLKAQKVQKANPASSTGIPSVLPTKQVVVSCTERLCKSDVHRMDRGCAEYLHVHNRV